jgi:hypothetical protein
MAKTKGRSFKELLVENKVSDEEAKQVLEYLLFLRYKGMLDMYRMMRAI